jgi:hypothetical protein
MPGTAWVISTNRQAPVLTSALVRSPVRRWRSCRSAPISAEHQGNADAQQKDFPIHSELVPQAKAHAAPLQRRG